MDARVKLSLPLVALDPDHAPEAVQLEALVEDQESVTVELIKTEEEEEEMVVNGGTLDVIQQEDFKVLDYWQYWE